MKQIIFLLSLILVFMSCSDKNKELKEKENNEKIISKPELKLKSDIMTPEVLWSFGRLGDVQVSPDEETLLFGITYYDIVEDKGNRELYLMSSKGGDIKQITKTAGGEYNAVWSKDGGFIYFMASADNGMQMFKMNEDGSSRKQISNIDGGINGFKLSPDQTKVLYIKEVNLVKTVVDEYSDLPKANARIIKDMMYRHWDTWTTSYSHIFIADFKNNTFSEGIDIMKDEEFDAPLKPFGGLEEINWSTDGKMIAYTCVKKKGRDYTVSTNSDIYFYKLETKTTENFTEGMNGYDKAPVFSSDGSKIAWESMERDGYESDKVRLFIYDFKTKEKKYYTKNFDQNASSLTWDAKNENIYFVSDYHARVQIYKLNLATNNIKAITKGDHNYRSVIVLSDKLIATKQSMSFPTEIFAVSDEGKETQISFVNKELLNQLEMGKVEERWVKTTDSKDMLVWVIYPPHFDKTKKYPALLYCQGGPQSSVSQFWSYRWNFQMMAADGYIVVAPNRRGLPSFGQEWNEQISGDYGGQNMQDYFSAIDELKKEPFIDENKLGAIGASYGGFSVYWLAGNHDKRFKAFIAHDGIFNLESQYTETEELWFANWDLGGAPWEKNNKIAQRTYSNSPHKFVDKWDTPLMVIHGGRDYRILDSQGFSAFDAAQLKGVPSKMLYFPEENHWVLHPQNGILWQREFKNWLDKWLK